MIKNYLKITWRNLVKNKTFSFINIFGLAVGLASFLLITLFVTDEISFDRYNEKADRIYRVDGNIVFGGNSLRLAVSSDPMGATLKRDYPQVEQFVRFYTGGTKLIKKDNEFIRENDVANADSTVFDVFTLPAVEGNTRTALNEPNCVVLSESTARKYFGTSTNVVGKQLVVGEGGEEDRLYKVTAVIKDVPTNSHFHFDFLFSMDNVQYEWGQYLSNNFQTYVVLRKGTDYIAFNKNFKQIISKYVLPQAKQFMNIDNIEQFEQAGNKLEYFLTPLTNIHLRSDRTGELGVNGDIQYVYIFSVAALFILLLACINFMNLSTARSANRAREVGIRKVLGTEKGSLIRQFLLESILMVVIALFLAIGLVWAFLSFFNSVTEKELSMASLLKPGYLTLLLALPIVVGTLAGIYPAFFLSSFKPIVVLKGKINQGFRKSYFRSGLVVTQFVCSIALIIGTIVIYRQLNFIQNKNIGFNKDQVLVLNGTGALKNNLVPFKNEVLRIDGVKAGAFSGYLPVGGSSRNDNSFSKEAVMDSRNGFNTQVWNVDYDYIPLLGMDILKGRNFSQSFGTDSSGVIINESLAKVLGYDNPVGEKIYSTDGESKPLTVLGVVKNFHFESLHQQIGPLLFRLGWNRWSASFKISTTDVRALISKVEGKWKEMAPGMPFSYHFLDGAFNEMYKGELKMGKVFMAFAILAILIACLGLFGLATYMAEQRTKEIGVRKVLGASVSGIVVMLSKDFARLVLIAAIVAFPLAWLGMHYWLQDFAYRVDIGWWIFLVAGLLALMIAILTVSFQAMKAALASPVQSLRTE